jgi:hypothetical protein
VTLTGSHLGSAVVVSFNGAWAKFVVGSDAQITAAVPAGATSGPVAVITRGGQTASAQDFVVTVTPALALSVRPAVSSLIRRVRLVGLLSPPSLAGANVTVTVQLRRGGAWKPVKTAVRATTAAGAYAWSYLPPRKGAYRAKAAIAPAPANTAAESPWSAFRVK